MPHQEPEHANEDAPSVRVVTGMQRVLEASIVTTTLLSLYLLLALYSFDPTDAAWTQVAISGAAGNWMGHTGAYLADILFFSIGHLAYAVPFLFAGLGYVLFKAHHKLRSIDFFTLGLRFIGFFLCSFGVLACASINFDDLHQTFSSGGVVGDMISSAMLPNFNFLGTTLLLICFIATGLTLMTGIGWMQLTEYIGSVVIKGSIWLWQFPERYARYSEAKREQAAGDALTQERYAEQDDEPERAPLTADTQKTDVVESEKMPSLNDVMSSSSSMETPTVSVESSELDDHTTMPSFSAVKEDEIEIDDLSEYQRPITNQQPNIDERIIEDELPPVESSTHELAQAIAAVQQKTVAVPNTEPMKTTKPQGALTAMPSLELLDAPKRLVNPIEQEVLDRVSRLVEAKLLDFNIQATVVDVFPGPVITRFELDLAPGVKVSKITGLSKDLARSLSALSVRVVEVIPGKSVIGLEIPNENREIVYLRENLACDKFSQSKSALTMVLGKDIAGDPVVVDLGKMPHLLVAGTTGSGKSVGVNAMILSLLYKSTPEQVRMIMIDPKMLELSVYEGIPHLLSEVVTDMKEAANALRWCVGEMERRYKLMSAVGVRNLAGYNAKVSAAIAAGEPLTDPLWQPGDSMDQTPPELETLPSIVVVVDEFADMIMIVGKKVEELIARIAQKARAAGIHLILATQRPSVDVITGLIKANIPTRIAFQVSSRVDSRTILDQQGAEQLLGQGDMLYLPPGTGVPTRVHGAFVDDHEVHKVVDDWKQRGEPNYISEILSGESNESILLPGEAAEGDSENDEFYDDAVAFVTETRRGSISSVQRKFKIGYNRAARLIEQMEASGVVSSPGHNGTREVLAPPPPKH
ncbi:DNA translocase FtsK [Psychrobium sp. 1_MG-2023]|uniref:DNA translocase FtsK n=1 Tax=Psychrobium sp. 1_MG-2023 TaxID=3062624 RepID=UPI000C340137|nr:DNA translocase FtsK [Psychrobium sp. 1_MG-2023]MDP2561867.1 DNA translocase FtsK 4TM domain-containing protein [Psychrobium sp. 1_MG-2023]PKF59788.1 cell division protein FtsK [Alteromonadales bacterium alter-6D02]